MTNNFPLLGVVLLLMTAYALPIISPRLRFLVKYLCSGLLLFSSVLSFDLLLKTLNRGPISYHLGGWPPPWGIEVRIDLLSALLWCAITTIAFFISLNVSREEQSTRVGRWYSTLLLLLVAAMLGLVAAADLFNLFVFSEVTTIAACALVAASSKRDSADASFKYLMLASLGSGFILFAIGLTWIVTGHLNMHYAALALASGNTPPLVCWAALCFFLVGFGLKAGVFPLHVWLPDAHSSAPTSASALLSGLVVKIYAVALARILFGVFGTALLQSIGLLLVLRTLAVLSILMGSAFALVQMDVKRMLAYSTVAQMGYIILGFGLASSVSLGAAIYHIAAHGLMKGILFLSAGQVIALTGSKKLTAFEGLGQRLPWTMAAFTLASLSMVGFPLMAGFNTKWLLLTASLDQNQLLLLLVIILSSLLTATYFLPLIWRIWFAPGEALPAPKKPLNFPVLALSGLLLAVGMFPNWLVAAARMAAERLL